LLVDRRKKRDERRVKGGKFGREIVPLLPGRIATKYKIETKRRSKGALKN